MHSLMRGGELISAYALIGSLPTLPFIEVGIKEEEMGRPMRIEYAGGRYHVINGTICRVRYYLLTH